MSEDPHEPPINKDSLNPRRKPTRPESIDDKVVNRDEVTNSDEGPVIESEEQDPELLKEKQKKQKDQNKKWLTELWELMNTPEFRSHVRRLGISIDDLDEAMQEFLASLDHEWLCEYAGASMPYIATCVANEFRSSKRRKSPELILNLDSFAAPQSSNAAEMSDCRMMFDEVLNGVYSKALLLRLQGLEYPEIAERLGKSEAAVSKEVQRKVNHLRELYGKRRDDDPPESR